MDLLVGIWEEYNIIKSSILESLKKNKLDQFLEIIENGLLKGGPYTFEITASEYSHGESLLAEMLSILNDHNSEKLIRILDINIMKVDFYELESICHFIQKTKIQECVPTIFKRIMMKSEAVDICALTKTILAFENENYNQQLKKV